MDPDRDAEVARGGPQVPRAHLLLLGLLTLSFVVLGWIGLDYGLPHVTHNDEIVYHSQYRALVENDPAPEARRRFVAYPAVWMRLAVHWPRTQAAASGPAVEAELSAAASDFLFLRRWVVVLSSLLAPAVWLLARRFVGSGWALIAAALSVTSLFHFCLATQARPHAVATVAIVLATAAAVEVVRTGTLRASLLSGLGAGAAIAALQSGAGALLTLIAAHALRWRADRRRASIGFALALCVAAPIFLFAYPAVWSNLLSRPFAAGQGHGFLASHGVVLRDFQGGGTPALLRAFAHHDPLLLASAAATLAVGGIVWLRRSRSVRAIQPELLVVLAFCVPYTIALCLFERTFYRFALPLFPFAALFAAIGLRALGRAGVAAAVLMILFQAGCVLQMVRLHRTEDTAQQAAAWIAGHVDRGSARILLSPWLDLPLVRTRAALDEHGLAAHEEVQPWLDHQRAMGSERLDALGWMLIDLPLRRASQREALRADARAFVRALEADYLVIDVLALEQRPLMALVREAAGAEGRLVARFTPQGPDEPAPRQVDPYVSADLFPEDRLVWQVWSASALGIGLEIYRFER